MGEMEKKNYVFPMTDGNSISVCFCVEDDKPLSVGDKMNEICEAAYMNGYNWEVFFFYYLSKLAPELLVGLTSDPESGSYAAYYDLTEKNEKKAKRFVEIIISLIENEEELYRIIREDGNKIKWD